MERVWNWHKESCRKKIKLLSSRPYYDPNDQIFAIYRQIEEIEESKWSDEENEETWKKKPKNRINSNNKIRFYFFSNNNYALLFQSLKHFVTEEFIATYEHKCCKDFHW
jgi:hypothetical protein